MEEKNGVFCYFHYEIIFYCVELFECTCNFKLCQNISIFLDINTNQTSKEQDLNFLRSNHLFSEQPQKEVVEVNCQAFNFTLRAFLRILVTFFRPVLKKFTKNLKVGKIFRCVTSLYQHFLVSDKICYYKTDSANSYN